MKNKKKEEIRLSEEDYEFISKTIGGFQKEAKELFKMIVGRFGNKGYCTIHLAVAINHLEYLKIPLRDHCEIDVGSEEAFKIFKDHGNFLTDGYYKGTFK